MHIKRSFCLLLLQLVIAAAYGQSATETPLFVLTIVNEKAQPVDGATVRLMRDDKPVKTAVTDNKGVARFEKIAPGTYAFAITYTGYKPQVNAPYTFPSAKTAETLTILPEGKELSEVSIVGKTPIMLHQAGKTTLNVDATPSNVGLTVLEVLERSPGIQVDRNGGIAMQGKNGVMVMIDDKPTYLSGADLNNMLSSMNSSQVAQIELITNPSAKYDAAGNAGIINIKTKKNKQKGFNGTFTTSLAQGIYPKNNNNLLLNYRIGNINTFLNYSVNYVEYLTDIYALRKYHDAAGNTVSTLDQPTYFKGNFLNNNLKTGIDYYLSPKTTIGLVLGGTAVNRKGGSEAMATWLSAAGAVDSAIFTNNKSNNQFRNGNVNLNLRHTFSAAQDLAVDVDYLHYNINNEQDFTNQLLAVGGYTDRSRGDIPTTINIMAGKADYTVRPGKTETWQFGVKSSFTKTDNTAKYENFVGGNWTIDNGKSNHFVYKEGINAAYTSYEKKAGKLSWQAGLRYEHTNYDAHQLGNAVQRDTAFSRVYGQFFPSGYISYQLDSLNGLSLSIGRRIDRPAFQVLNPFYFIINKYTYQTGNAYILPQYTWNFEVSHQYKSWLTTTVSYSNIRNYFSQLFLNDAAKGILLYTQGNVGQTHNFGVATTVQVAPVKWWNLTAQANYNYKQLKGINGNNFTSNINQLNLNANNQFTIAKIYTAELSGFYTTRARNDVQELLYPTGQMSVGLSRPVLKKMGTLKFSARDLFYTQAMEGLTTFPNATEYFILRRDTRVFTLSFTYRFGKAYKAAKRSTGGAADEAGRVGNG